MSVRITLVVSCLFFGMAWSTASAEEPRLTLETCLRAARAQSPQLKASENSVRLGSLAEAENLAAGLPQIKGALGALYAPVPPPFGYDPVISNGGQLNAQIVVQQRLYDGGAARLKSDQLHRESEHLVLEHRRTERDLLFSVKEAFIEALRSQREAELHRTSISLLQQYLDLVRRLYRGGSGSYTDVLKSELQLLSEQALLQKAEEAAAIGKVSLSELINAPLDSSMTLAGSLETLIVPASPGEGSADSSSLLAQQPPLELEIAQNGIDRSLIDIELAKHERAPLITLVGDGGYLSSIENLRLPADMRLSSFGFSVGLELEVPLFNGGATALRIEQREIASENLRFQHELARRSHLSDVKKIRMRLSNAQSRLQSIRSGIAKAEENYLLTKSKYAAGAALSLEVLSAEELMTESRLNELETLADIQHIHARIEQLAAQ